VLLYNFQGYSVSRQEFWRLASISNSELLEKELNKL
jgi:hypothetical protein